MPPLDGVIGAELVLVFCEVDELADVDTVLLVEDITDGFSLGCILDGVRVVFIVSAGTTFCSTFCFFS